MSQRRQEFIFPTVSCSQVPIELIVLHGDRSSARQILGQGQILFIVQMVGIGRDKCEHP